MSTESVVLYEKLIYDNQDKFYQLRLVANEFKGRQYIHIRKYSLLAPTCGFDLAHAPIRCPALALQDIDAGQI